MTTDTIVKYAVAGILIIGYAVVVCAYIWAPHGTVADDKVAAMLIGALTSGYLLAIQTIFRT